LWETSADNPKFFWRGHMSKVTSVSFSPDGHFIASSSFDNTVKLWSAHSETLVSVFTGHTAPATSVVFSPSGSQMASSSYDRTVRIWELNSVGSSFDMHGQPDPAATLGPSENTMLYLANSYVSLDFVARVPCTRRIPKMVV
ncbi:hypothetical protein BGX29_005462, partial [Mortierella sp. GBA35]